MQLWIWRGGKNKGSKISSSTTREDQKLRWRLEVYDDRVRWAEDAMAASNDFFRNSWLVLYMRYIAFKKDWEGLFFQPTAVPFISNDNEKDETNIREFSDSWKNLPKFVNIKWTYNEVCISLRFIVDNNLPYFVICNRIFLNSTVLQLLLIIYKEKGIKYVQKKQDELFKMSHNMKADSIHRWNDPK